MKKLSFLALTVAAILFFSPDASAQQQEPDMDKMISGMLKEYVKIFELDEVQEFLLDSVLYHNYPALIEELNNAKKSGASNEETFTVISDKWMAKTDDALLLLLNDKQKARFEKNGFGREKAKRDKRMAERKKAAEKL